MPIGLNHSQPATYEGDLYVAGGYLDGLYPTNQFWRYDPDEDRWDELPPMHLPRGAAGTAVVGDKLYVAGGAPQVFNRSVAGAPYASLEIYDFETGEWSSGADVLVPRHHTAAVGLGGKLYLAGGRTGLLELNDDVPPSDDFERYDPDTDEWEILPSMPLGVGFEGATAAAGKVVVVGGEDQRHWEDGGGWATSSAWAYDPRTDRWQRLPDMNFDRRGFGAVTAGGRIYAPMGGYCPGLTPKGPLGTHTMESLPVSEITRAEEQPKRG